MKKIKIEVQVILLTICIAIAVIVSGTLAYQSLSEIVDTIHKEARPDLKLLLIKDIASDLSEVENTIRLYSLTGDTTFLHPYRQLDTSIHEKLSNLANYVLSDQNEIADIDTIGLLTNRKLLIWDEIRALHHSKTDPHNTFSKLYSRIDTAIIHPDTIRFKPAVKKGFFKRIFSKNDTTTRRPIIIDKSKDKEVFKKELADLEQKIISQTKKMQTKEMVLLEKNIQLTQKLNQHIVSLENSEQKRLETKTLEADLMAEQTYQRMTIFTIAAVILLIIILLLFFRNLRKNRTYQQFLKKAKADAESLTKAKEMFVATVSHEMRTPVNAIYGLTGQMLQKTDSVEMTSDLKVVYKSAEHLIALVNDTLDLSRIESQKLKFELIDFLPDEILLEVYKLHKDSAQKKGIDLIMKDETDSNPVLQGDPIRLKQILINLITNAIKFTNQGQITITSKGEETSGQNILLNIEVSDTGIGISKENLNLIFDEFVQLDTDLTQKQRGAGLGLAIVKKLVLLQNGKIEVDSIPGKGTRFKLQIPYIKGNPDRIKKQIKELIVIPSWIHKLHFLIVDDEEFNRYLIKNILTKWEVSFTEANNGQEAVDLALKYSYDLILMDIRMPLMDGYEATKQILQNCPSSKIIALTATTKPLDIAKIELSGMHAFLQKPFTESSLLIAIIKLLQKETDEHNHKISEEQKVVDFNELKLILGGDDLFINEMLRLFIHSSEEALVKFKQYSLTANIIGIVETAHKLAAPAKHLNETLLYDHLKKLENTTERGEPNEVKNLIGIIEMEINRINSFLKEKLGEA